MAKVIQVDANTNPILELVKRVENLLNRQVSNPRQRILIALAGVPGSGKSTVSHGLVNELAAQGIRDVMVLPMDGFHYTRAQLSAFEDSDRAFRLRGAPFTFDGTAFVNLVRKLGTTPVTIPSDPQELISAPSFDHAAKDPIPDSITISTDTRLVVIEGNYTLLDEEPWVEISRYCAERWFVDAAIDEIRNRIANRHVAAGIEDTVKAAIDRANENDIPNGNMIRARLITPDVIINN